MCSAFEKTDLSTQDGHAVTLVRRRALALFNDRARAVAGHAEQVVATLESFGFEIVRPQIADRESAARLVREHARDVDVVIAVGGDGTLNAVLQGLIETDLPFGIVPLGTANDLCKTLGIPMDLAAACEVIARGHTRRIDVGRVNGVCYFLEASIGLSVALCRRLTSKAKARFGIIAHVYEALAIVRRMRRFHAVVTADGKELVLQTAQLTIGNSRNFGGLVASEEASIDDRRLDLYSVAFRHWWSYFEAVVSLLRRRYDDVETVFTRHARTFEVRTRRPMQVEADGEIVSRTPARFEVVPRSVAIFVPAPDTNKP